MPIEDGTDGGAGDYTGVSRPNKRAHREGGGLPWPEPFPDWKGLAAIRNVGTWGDGWFIGTQDYTNVEWHPDTERFHDIARMTFRMTVDSLPEVCPLDPEHDTVGKHTTYQSYFQVDRGRKVMQLIGSKYVGKASALEITDFFQVNGNNPDTRGEWTFYRRDEEAVQYILNANNTVLREVDYATSPTSVYAGSDNVKFNVIASQKHQVAPDIEGILSPAELVDDKLQEIKKYVVASDSMYYNASSDGRERHVDVVAEFNQITAVDTPYNRFFASLAITFKWKITKDDMVAYIISPDQDAWEPQFVPPTFHVKNPASGDGAAIMAAAYSNIIKKKEKFKGKKSWIAKQTLTIEGDFYEEFELENYPFDIQPLAVVLESRGTNKVAFNCQWSGATEEGFDLPNLRDTEWSGRTGEASHEFIKDEEDDGVDTFAAAGLAIMAVNRLAKLVSGDKEAASKMHTQKVKAKTKHGVHVLSMEAVAIRSAQVHIFRVFAVMALLSLASIVALCADPKELINTLDRVGVVFTLMLTATAYSLVIADGLPTLGYLTFIDKYILATFAFIALVGVEITVIDWVAGKHFTSAGEQLYTPEDAFEYAAYVDLVLWFLLNVALYIYVNRWIIPLEERGDTHGGDEMKKEAIEKNKKQSKTSLHVNVCRYVSEVSTRTCARMCAPGKEYCSQLHLCQIGALDCGHKKASNRSCCENEACKAVIERQDDDHAAKKSASGRTAGGLKVDAPSESAKKPGTPEPVKKSDALLTTPEPGNKKGSSNKVAPTEAGGSDDADVRGVCGKCGQNVLATQPRTKSKGVYNHDVCPK